MDWNAWRRRPIRGWYRRHERAIWATTGFVGVFVVWELAATLGLTSRQFVSSPSGILTAGVREVQQARFWNDVQTSLFEFATGYGLAVLAGIPLGLTIGWYRRVSYYFEPLLNFLYATPRIALMPLIVLWFGIGIWSKVAIVFLGAFVTILLNTYSGVRTVDQRHITVAEAFGAGEAQTFKSVVFPSSVPFMLAGLRLGIGRALIGVVVGELYASNAGIGFMLTVAANNFQIDRMLFGVVLLIILGIVTVEALRFAERRLAPWRLQVVAD